MRYIKPLRISHIILILCLPILLAFINPNWIFNPHITDDYIYLGYQMEMPRYTDWFPAADRYFGERVSWIAPAYIIRQLTSPLVANFIIHLGVYYVAIFSIYGILRKLSNPNSAIITALLMGHYPAFMRAVGWDYVDGFIIACVSLCLLLITYACYSQKNWRLYLIGAGAMFTAFVTANLFYACYVPVMAIYAMWLNYQHKKHPFITCAFWIGIGAFGLYGLEGIYYQSLTGNWLTFTNSLTFTQTKIDDQFRYINNYNFLKLFPTWHILPLLVMIITGIRLIKRNYPIHLRPIIVLPIGTYLVLLIWESLGHRFLYYAFYSSIIIPMWFIVLGILIEKYMTKRNWVVYASFFIPALPFLIFSLSPETIATAPLGAIMLIGIALFLVGFMRWNMMAIIGAFTLLGMVVGLSPYRQGFSVMPTSIMTYIPNRYENQAIYVGASELAIAINHHFDQLNIETFRLWYANDPKMRTLHAVASIYVHGGRVIDDNDLPENVVLVWRKNTRYIPNNTIILLSSQHTPDELFLMAQNAFLRYGYMVTIQKTIWINDGDGGFYAVFATLEDSL